MMKRIVLIASGLVLQACDVGPIESVFVVPDGYRGRLAVVVMDGYPPGHRKEDGRHIYEFPPSGVICEGKIRDLANGLKNLSARYASGAAIPTYADWNSPIEFEGVRFRLLPQMGGTRRQNSDGKYEYLTNEFWAAVGTSEEVRAANRAVHGEQERNQDYCTNG